MSHYPQLDALRLGRSGCYFFCLLRIAEKEKGQTINALDAYTSAIESGFINRDCYIINPAAFLRSLVGGEWRVTHAPAQSEGITHGDYVVRRLAKKKTMREEAHFVLEEEGKIWDPSGVYDNDNASWSWQSSRLIRRIS